MKPSSPEDRLRWPRDQFPHWNRVMDFLDVEIAAGLVDMKVTTAHSLGLGDKAHISKRSRGR